MLNDSELDSQLRSLRVPERGADYWQAFPQRVMAKTRALPEPCAQAVWPPRFAWATGVALASLVTCLCVSPGNHCPLKVVLRATQTANSLRKELAQLPQGARALMRIDHGLSFLVEEQQ